MPGYYDTASGQWIEDNSSGQGQMPGTVDPEDPYEIGKVDPTRIDQEMGRAQDFSEQYYNQVAEGGGYGQAMLNKGLGYGQNAMQSQAVSRGANPMAERAAILGGGQMMRQGAVDAAGIRAQEMSMASQQRQDMLNQNVAMQQWYQQMERQRQMADQQHYATMTGIEVAEDAQQANTAMQGVGMGMQAAGSMGMMSDIKLKDGRCIPSADLSDDALSSLSGSGEPPPAYHGVTINDEQGLPTRFTSRFGTAGNSPVKDLGPRDADPVLPDGSGAIAGYRPTADSGPVNGAPQPLSVNPQVSDVVAYADPVSEYGKLMAGMAANKSSADSGGGGLGGAGAAIGGMFSDIRLKDGTCVPDPSRQDGALGSMGNPYAARLGLPPGIRPSYGASLPPGIRPGGQYGAMRGPGGSMSAGFRPGAKFSASTHTGNTGMMQSSGAPAVANSANQAYNVQQKYGSDAVASDIRLKDGTCIPASALADEVGQRLARHREFGLGEPIGRRQLSREDIISRAERNRARGEALGIRISGAPSTEVGLRPEFSRGDLQMGRLGHSYQPYSRQMGFGDGDPDDIDPLIAEAMRRRRAGGYLANEQESPRDRFGYAEIVMPNGMRKTVPIDEVPHGIRAPQARGDYASLAAALDRAGAETDAELDRTSSHLQPKTWHYRPEAQRALGLPGGKRVGPMAQDLERSELGKLAVMETPAGKAIDRDAALGLSLGLHGREAERDDEIARRVSALEAALKREGRKTESKL